MGWLRTGGAEIWAFAGAPSWAAPASFDRRLTRMREASPGEGIEEPPRLAPVVDGRQNEDR